MQGARIQEIFVSIQGEGRWTGQRHIFVRFQGCDIQCRYCDTADTPDKEAAPCSVQVSPGFPAPRERVPNPIAANRLTELCARLRIPGPSRPWISLTGGEPLLHQDFLLSWLPLIQKDYGVYLESNGIRADAMKNVRDLVDVVSMDFKLPSATRLRPFWEEHRRFLAAAKGKQTQVKAVVTDDTTRDDILTAAQVIAEFDASVLLVLQPASGALAPTASTLMEFQDAALRIIQDVRVIPQAHKILKVP